MEVNGFNLIVTVSFPYKFGDKYKLHKSSDSNKITLTKVFIDLSKVVHRVSISQLKPG